MSVTRRRDTEKRFALDQSGRNDEAEHENDGAERDPEAQPLLDLVTDGVAIAVEQDGDDKKTAAAGDHRAHNEQPVRPA